MNITWDFVSQGRAEFTVEANGSTRTWNVHDWPDPTGALVYNLVTLIEGKGTLYEKINIETGAGVIKPFNSVEFTWECSPGGVYWTLTLLENDVLQIRIDTLKEAYHNESVVPGESLTATCPLREFVTQVVANLERLLVDFGFVGYRMSTMRDFPLSSYFLLKDHYLATSTIPDFFDDLLDDELPGSSLDQELEFLRELIGK